MSAPTFDNLLGAMLMHGHADINALIPAATLQETRDNIIAASAATVRFAIATDTLEIFFANGSAWYLLPFKFYLEPTAPDMGAYQDSSRIGYYENDITDKTLHNVSLGDNANTSTGGIRWTGTYFQIYYNSKWNNAVIGFTFSEASDKRLQHTPSSEIYDAFSGNSQSLGFNNIPITQQYNTSLGAYPDSLKVDGGNADMNNQSVIVDLLNRQIFHVLLRRDTYANLKANNTYYFEGEPAYPTDKTGRLYVGNSSNRITPVQSLDMAVCYDDQVVCNNNEIVYAE